MIPETLFPVEVIGHKVCVRIKTFLVLARVELTARLGRVERKLRTLATTHTWTIRGRPLERCLVQSNTCPLIGASF